ncbi:MAG: DUF885 domain-containing protein [Fidelibacterota bacterium]|nr:MAG: DUF885 domain-containing protein [Candidatus Neomarinimicrobiota bacterium]
MKRTLGTVVLILLAFLLATCSGPNRATRKLHALFDESWEWTLQEFPEYATYLGDDRYNDRLTDVSLAAVERRQKYTIKLLDRLATINRDALSAEDKLNYDLFRHQQEISIEGFQFKDYLMPVDQRNGPQLSLPRLVRFTRFRNTKDYEDYLKRLHQITPYMEQLMALMEAGKAADWVPPAILLEKVPDQLVAQTPAEAGESLLFQPFKNFPEDISAEDKTRILDEGHRTIREQVIPAFQRLHDYVSQDYLPSAREAVGAWALPEGDQFYTYRAKVFTTTDQTPDEIHEIGLQEVARIRHEMERVIEESGFTGSFDEFTEFLRTDAQFYFTEPRDLLLAYRDICKRVDPELARLFGHLPRTPYGVQEIPAYLAPTTTTAYYERPAADGSRAGYFFANTYRLDQRPKYEMEALALHEAVPGHHLQIALAMEMKDLPMFRSQGGYTAFIEGWALYAESLGEEMGFYQDPYSKFGQLMYEMWRAVRLVVDTGIHHQKWTRQQAIDFFTANTAKTEHDIAQEVDRYIALPGQALAYKIGELKIKELRAEAAAALGSKFDLRTFHDAVLGRGAVPLDILAEGIATYITENQPDQ